MMRLLMRCLRPSRVSPSVTCSLTRLSGRTGWRSLEAAERVFRALRKHGVHVLTPDEAQRSPPDVRRAGLVRRAQGGGWGASLLGEGGFGTVYRVWTAGLAPGPEGEPALPTSVAVKLEVLCVYDDDDAVGWAEERIERFATATQIARAAAEVGVAPRIFDTFAFARLDGGLELVTVMELVDGVLVSSFLEDAEPSLREAVVERAAEHVRTLASHGYKHGDLHTSNAMVVFPPQGGVDVRLLDFGEAEAVDACVTKGWRVTSSGSASGSGSGSGSSTRVALPQL